MSSLDVPPPRLRHETIRRVIDVMVTDLIAETRRRLAKLAPHDADAVRRAKQRVVAFSPPMAEANQVIKDFLNARMYRGGGLPQPPGESAGRVHRRPGRQGPAGRAGPPALSGSGRAARPRSAARPGRLAPQIPGRGLENRAVRRRAPGLAGSERRVLGGRPAGRRTAYRQPDLDHRSRLLFSRAPAELRDQFGHLSGVECCLADLGRAVPLPGDDARARLIARALRSRACHRLARAGRRGRRVELCPERAIAASFRLRQRSRYGWSGRVVVGQTFRGRFRPPGSCTDRALCVGSDVPSRRTLAPLPDSPSSEQPVRQGVDAQL